MIITPNLTKKEIETLVTILEQAQIATADRMAAALPVRALEQTVDTILIQKAGTQRAKQLEEYNLIVNLIRDIKLALER